MKSKYILFLFSVIAFVSCNDEFLERFPQDQLSNETYWNTENDLRLFMNTVYTGVKKAPWEYGFFQGHTGAFTSYYASETHLDAWSDNMAPTNSWGLRIPGPIRTCQMVVGTGARTFGWYWNILRDINFFIENYNKAELSEGIKNQYAGEARMFRAWFYWDKVKKFGDVPWINKVVNIDSPELTAARDPRTLVMDSVLADINYAVKWMPEIWVPSESPGRLNKWAALALKSRICLYEGTYRKYRGQDGWQTWLQAAADAAKQIMDGGKYYLFTTGNPTMDYWTLFSRSDLTGNPEIIYWKKYQSPINAHHVTGYIISWDGGYTKDVAEDYLCTDGKPVSLSPLYQGDNIVEQEFVNRDARMRQTILHPEDSGPFKYRGDDKLSYPRLVGMTGGALSSGGYHTIKFCNSDNYGYGIDPLAGIIFRYGEVLLNYAEAKVELGSISQGDLDMSVNLLRDRINMPHLTMNPPMDPKYANEGLSSLLVEVRRERRIELLQEGFRYDDLMRWKKGEYLAKKPLGIRWEESNAAEPRYEGNTVKRYTDPTTGKSYIDIYQGTPYENITWNDKFYLWPIPLNSIAQNPNLAQNPGW